MPNTLESRIERAVCKRALSEMGIDNIKLAPAGKNGFPDRMFFIPGGRPLLIEFKKPGEDARPLQKGRARILGDLGYNVEICDDEEKALNLIELTAKCAQALAAAQVSKKGR